MRKKTYKHINLEHLHQGAKLEGPVFAVELAKAFEWHDRYAFMAVQGKDGQPVACLDDANRIDLPLAESLSTEWVLLFTYSQTGNLSGVNFLFDFGSGSSRRIVRISTAGSFEVYNGSTYTVVGAAGAASAQANDGPMATIAVAQRGSTLSIWKDGKLVGSMSMSGAVVASNIALNNRSSTFGAPNNTISMGNKFGMFARIAGYVPDSRIKSLTTNPYQIFYPVNDAPFLVGLPSGAGAIPFIGVGQAASISVTGQQGSIVAGFEGEGASASLSLTGQQGSAQVGSAIPFIGTGINASVAITGQQGSLQAGSSVPFIGTGQAASISVTGQQGSVSIGQTLTGTNATVTVTGQTGTLTAGTAGQFIGEGQAASVAVTGQQGSGIFGHQFVGAAAAVAINGQQGSLQLTSGTPFLGVGQSATVAVVGQAGIFTNAPANTGPFSVTFEATMTAQIYATLGETTVFQSSAETVHTLAVRETSPEIVLGAAQVGVDSLVKTYRLLKKDFTARPSKGDALLISGDAFHIDDLDDLNDVEYLAYVVT